ncbi:Uncharacterised protein [Vibrio cholerae]|uniref:Uncharacterized protein n=1 Tax=Vibrio cholerae TaxID=666 RepID=A0A655UST1_VIBCL|nr:Uncharacterised protein [Vibrio cholerae]
MELVTINGDQRFQTGFTRHTFGYTNDFWVLRPILPAGRNDLIGTIELPFATINENNVGDLAAIELLAVATFQHLRHRRVIIPTGDARDVVTPILLL